MTTAPHDAPANAIEHLYEVFARYPRPERVAGCPCCVGGIREAAVLSRPLRELTRDDLDFYSFKAMTTFGTVEDFKYFLPRLAEILAAGERFGVLDVDGFTRKLQYAGLAGWPVDEIDALRGWTAHLWRHAVTAPSYPVSAREVLAVARIVDADTAGWIDDWLEVRTQPALLGLIDAVWSCAERNQIGGAPESAVHAELLRAGPRLRAAVERYAHHDPEHAARTLELLDFPPFEQPPAA